MEEQYRRHRALPRKYREHYFQRYFFIHLDEKQQHFLSIIPIAGTILLAIGSLFLLNNFDFIELGPVTHFWPLIVIAIGVTKFLTAEQPGERRKGAWWMMIGLWLLISTLHLYGFSFHNSWPILLIVLGINSLWRALDPQSTCRHSKGYHYAN